jgi:hypothetical protein
VRGSGREEFEGGVRHEGREAITQSNHPGNAAAARVVANYVGILRHWIRT